MTTDTLNPADLISSENSSLTQEIDSFTEDAYSPETGDKQVSGRIDFTSEMPHRKISAADSLFPILLAVTVSLGIFAGITARSVPPIKNAVMKTVHKIKTEFHFSEPRKIEPPAEPEIKKEKKAPEKPEVVDLTKSQPEPLPQETAAEPPPPEAKPVRKVFGLRKVFSTGLGAGSSSSGGIVAKIGNTINKEYDTVTATDADIRGTVVSAATVSKAHKFRKIIKPVYTKEMIEQKIEGTVKVKVLVDIDGRVKKATCLNDLGFGSAQEAVKATLQMLFDPGMRDDNPVAVWIIVPITFALLG